MPTQLFHPSPEATTPACGCASIAPAVAHVTIQLTFGGELQDYDVAMRRQLRSELAQRLQIDRNAPQLDRSVRENMLVEGRFDACIDLPLSVLATSEEHPHTLAEEIASWEGQELGGKTLLEAIVRPDFPACAREYDPAAAWWLALLSGLAYREKEFAARHLEFDGFSKVTFFDVNGTQGYLAQHPGMGGHGPFAVLAFRGTEVDIKDILTDLRISQRRISCDDHTAHEGFLSALDEVWSAPRPPQWDGKKISVGWFGHDGVEQALDAIEVHGPLFMTGHSLGGALATLAAYRRPPAALYTFGSPRVAGKDLARHLNGEQGINAWRVVNSTDIVPRVPPPLGYRHVGHLVYLTFEGSVARYRTGILALGRFVFEMYVKLGMIALAWLPKSLTRFRNPGVFGNHKITEYIRKLEGNLPLAALSAEQAAALTTTTDGEISPARPPLTLLADDASDLGSLRRAA